MEQTLMSLVGEHAEIMALVDDPEVDQQTVLDTLDSIEGAIEVKADGYSSVLRGIKYEREFLNCGHYYLLATLKIFVQGITGVSPPYDILQFGKRLDVVSQLLIQVHPVSDHHDAVKDLFLVFQ